MYADAGSYLSNLTGPIEPLLVLLERQNDTLNGVLTFGVGLPQSQFCKRDTFVRQRSDTPACHDAMQVNGAFSVWRKNFHSLRVVDAWLRDCMDHQSLSDSPSSSPELPAFRKHRHDQAILTNVLTREGWGRDVTNGPATFMIKHDRNKA